MSPAIPDLDQLAALSLPEPLVMHQFAGELEEQKQAIPPLERRLREATAAVRSGKTQREQFEATAPVASPEKIAAERALRTAGWQPLRKALLGEGTVPAPGPLASMLLSFETSVAEADRLADQAILDADRLAAYLTNERQVATHEQAAVELEAELRHARESEAEGSRRWLALWKDVATEPQAPREMILWLAEARRLLGLRDDLLTNTQEAERVRSEIAGVRPLLDDVLAALAIEGSNKLSDKLALAAARAELGERERFWRLASELVVLEANAAGRLKRLEESKGTGEEQLAAWQLEWRSTLPSLHLSEEADCDDAEAVLALWQLVPDKAEALAMSVRRVSGMQRDMKAFEDQTFAMLDRLGEAKDGVAADAVVKLMTGRVREAQAQQDAHREAERQLGLLAGKVTAAKATVESRRTQFSQLSADLPVTDDAAAQLESLEQRAEILRELTAQRETLTSLARNQTEKELRQSLEGFNEAEATATVHELRRQDDFYNSEENTKFSELKDARRELNALQAGAGAEFSLQQKKNAEAELLEHTHDWAVKRLGQILLAQAVETHRSRQEQPLLQRASELFTMLTAGSFASIEQEAEGRNDEQKVWLVGRRDAEQTVCLSAMSTGTRDQLYLALRLAYLEQYAGSTESVPFIGDDLFTSSDEKRTTQGLKALAATGHLIQPILFTHHEHVVELACKELGQGVDVIVFDR
jgi:hypothetical protein